MVVVSKDALARAHVQAMSAYIQEELNVRLLEITDNEAAFGVRERADPNHKVLGVRLKGAYKAVMEAVRLLTPAEIAQFRQEGRLTVAGQELGRDDLNIVFDCSKDASSTAQWELSADPNGRLLVLLDVEPPAELQDEGVAREMMNRIQRLRKTVKKNALLIILIVSSMWKLFFSSPAGEIEALRSYCCAVGDDLELPAENRHRV